MAAVFEQLWLLLLLGLRSAERHNLISHPLRHEAANSAQPDVCWSWRPNGNICMSGAILLDAASSLHLLTGWDISVPSSAPCVPISQSFLGKEQV